MAMGNREQHIERELKVGESEISNNLKKEKEKNSELIKRFQVTRDRELLEMHPNEMNEDSEFDGKKNKEVIVKLKKKRLKIMTFIS